MENTTTPGHNMHKNAYKKFFLMLLASFIIMYAVMFLNVAEFSHIYLSTTRTYMSLLMVMPMAFLMLGLMRHMYTNRKLNIAIMTGAGLVFVITFYMLRTQAYISDAQYMKAMIPHHSSAIMTSRHADIRNPEVRQLSEQIIESQREEIAQMKAMLERID